MSERDLSAVVAEMREAFDLSFAAPLVREALPVERLLAIRAGGEPYALRLSDLKGLSKDRRITPIPSRLPEMVGVAGLRGALVPVYDLAALLGHISDRRELHWLAVAGPGRAVAFAFEGLDGYLEVQIQHIATGGEGARQVVHAMGGARALISLESMVVDIRRRIEAAGRG